MISTDNLCMSCMREIGDARQCPYCGYYVDSAQIAPYLPVRTVIANRYLVGKLIDYNGEGATYIGWDINDKKPVNIREFFPDSIAIRTSTALTLKVMSGSEALFSECNQSFLELWTKLSRFKGLSALINVTNVVEDYGTSYAIYDHIEGGVTLREYLLSSKTGYVPWEKARQLLMPILSTLGTLHSAGIIHRGISPSTLIIGRDGKVRITGFGIWQSRSQRGEINSQLFPGYAAIEQYGFDGQQGPWTDIYAFGAVLYRTLIGSDPIDATERVTNDRLMVPGKFAEQLPAYVINGLINALQILPEDRTRTVEQLRAELSASPVAAASESVYTSPRKSQTSPITIPVINQPVTVAGNDDDDDEYDYEELRRSKAAKSRERKTTFKTVVICLTIGLIAFTILVLTVWRDDFGITWGSDNQDGTSISGEGDTVLVPNFIGRSRVDVTQDPQFTKDFNFEISLTYSDAQPKGYIIDQSIKHNTEVGKGTTIVLTVSEGKEQVEIPADIAGKSYQEAYRILTSLGFTVERKEKSYPGYYSPEEVISSTPAAGKKCDKGSKVILMVNTGPTEPPTQEPETSSFSPDYNPPLDDSPEMEDPGLDYTPDEDTINVNDNEENAE
ncbi:MAG: PASTA domain-containing protein [Clostridia bacterium]|nr:PASTA domain-containing protein [Clostridia bacterium]